MSDRNETFQTRTRARAQQLRLAVVKTESAETYTVASQTQEVGHTVEVFDGQYELCDCASFEHRSYCVHVATVQLLRRGLL